MLHASDASGSLDGAIPSTNRCRHAAPRACTVAPTSLRLSWFMKEDPRTTGSLRGGTRPALLAALHYATFSAGGGDSSSFCNDLGILFRQSTTNAPFGATPVSTYRHNATIIHAQKSNGARATNGSPVSREKTLAVLHYFPRHQ
jgi:hypothetical protein